MARVDEQQTCNRQVSRVGSDDRPAAGAAAPSVELKEHAVPLPKCIPVHRAWSRRRDGPAERSRFDPLACHHAKFAEPTPLASTGGAQRVAKEMSGGGGGYNRGGGGTPRGGDGNAGGGDDDGDGIKIVTMGGSGEEGGGAAPAVAKSKETNTFFSFGDNGNTGDNT